MFHSITVRKVKSKQDLRAFIHLPAKLHKNHPNWVPPIYMDDWEFFNPIKNKSFLHCEFILLLALKNKQVVGRAMGLIHKDYNSNHNEKDVRFSFLETPNDALIFNSLVDFIKNWGKEKGMNRLVGPLAFSDKDPQGFLIDGFNEPISIATTCNYKYMVDLCNNYGFKKKVDLVVYKIEIPDELPKVYDLIYERFIRNKSDLRIEEFTSRKKLKPFIRPTLQLVNDTFSNIYGFTPFSPKEMDDFANRYLFLINPNFVKLVINTQNEVVAMVIAMSDISKGIQKAKGRLFPIGLFHILRAEKKSIQLNLLLGAVHPKYQGRGLDALMGSRLISSAKQAKKTLMDSHLELETNIKVRAEMERLGGQVYKTYRIYQLEL